MDQCRTRIWTRHRVWQPNIQGKLSRLTSYADQHKERNGNNRCRCNRVNLFEDFIELEATECPEHNETCNEKAKVTDTIGNKSFLSGIRIRPGGTCERIHLVPETNQQEGAESHTFPTNEEHQVGIAADEDHHGGNEKVEENEEATEPSHIIFEADIFVHVPDGVDVNERPNARDNQHHRRG